MEHLENEEKWNQTTLQKMEQTYQPDCVIIEFNGMWNPEIMFATAYPQTWAIAQVMTIVNSATFQNYYANMRQLMAAQFKLTDLVVFNRFDDGTYDKFYFRSACKAQNMRVQVVYEYPNGEVDTVFDTSPFDLTKKVIDVPEEDFPTWYFDVMDNADRYDGKIVHVLCRVAKLTNPKQTGFVMGRHVMTCCAEDIQFMGIYCVNNMQFDWNGKSCGQFDIWRGQRRITPGAAGLMFGTGCGTERRGTDDVKDSEDPLFVGRIYAAQYREWSSFFERLPKLKKKGE